MDGEHALEGKVVVVDMVGHVIGILRRFGKNGSTTVTARTFGMYEQKRAPMKIRSEGR